MADGIVVGVSATGSDHMTRQEASQQEGLVLFTTKFSQELTQHPTRTTVAGKQGPEADTSRSTIWRKPLCRGRLEPFVPWASFDD